MTKSEKKQLKQVSFFLSKIAFYQHIKKLKLLPFFLFLWVIFALLDSYPNPDTGTQLNPDSIRIRNTSNQDRCSTAYLMFSDLPQLCFEILRSQHHLTHARVVARDERVVDVRQQPQLVVIQRHYRAWRQKLQLMSLSTVDTVGEAGEGEVGPLGLQLSQRLAAVPVV
jgi:hypothetical protein